ncbi:hypothetical protein Smic_16130 [Streptomyces microflavus]|uniref:Uncharacterized protein n=1 Tax=Streptomyces microflavus TaxID=1919 RepID=A0A7J0CMZ0_STRMI|nr:hypothetical protein Smic_16130 [Streptomyces microflavus]
MGLRVGAPPGIAGSGSGAAPEVRSTNNGSSTGSPEREGGRSATASRPPAAWTPVTAARVPSWNQRAFPVRESKPYARHGRSPRARFAHREASEAYGTRTASAPSTARNADWPSGAVDLVAPIGRVGTAFHRRLPVRASSAMNSGAKRSPERRTSTWSPWGSTPVICRAG